MASDMDPNRLSDFWGIKKKGIALGVGRPYRKGFLGLELSGKLKPPWMKEGVLKIPFPETFLGMGAKCLASFSYEKERVPAISLEGEEVVFNFNPRKTLDFLLNERYLKPRRPFYTRLPINYSKLPRGIRALGAGRGKVEDAFPSWPIEGSVETIRWAFLESLEILHGKIETKPFWPRGGFCATLTHDVDTGKGFENIGHFVDIEESLGMTSCWNVVGKGYEKDFRVLDGLIRGGHEIGLHDVRHDNRIAFLGEEKIRRRIREAEGFMKRYSIKGFRSPSMLRSDGLFKVLGEFFLYDSSVPDTERFSQIGKANGCCSVFPFFRGGILEIPLTVPQDSCLLKTYRPKEIFSVWREKVDWIARVGGLACINTHPDPHFSGNPEMLRVYERFLKYLKRKRPWLANPSEVAKWWLKR